MPDEGDAIISITSESIKDRIRTIRGVQVMLDRDLAELYGVETKVLNQALKRNRERFPDNFCFQLSKNEFEFLRSQLVTTKSEHRGGRRYLPFVFTEEGVVMLSGIIRSDIAVSVSIRIMEAFVAMRHLIISNAGIFQRISNVEIKLLEHDEKINEVFKQLEQPREPKAVMFFKGEMYDAAVLIKELIGIAKSEIILVGNYTDRKTIDCFVCKKRGVLVSIYTQRQNCQILQSEIADFNSQHGSLSLNFINTFHDRFLIIDRSRLYHVGASLKDAGKKAFAISEIEDVGILKSIISSL